MYLAARVTRLGEFSFGKFFMQTTEAAQLGVHFFQGKNYPFRQKLGSMLRSQFSAIFDNFRRKNWRFSQKRCYDNFLHNLTLFRVKEAIFSQNFSAKIFKKS
jgi:hypothetical protein